MSYLFVTMDYKEPPPGSLEAGLLPFQGNKVDSAGKEYAKLMTSQ